MLPVSVWFGIEAEMLREHEMKCKLSFAVGRIRRGALAISASHYQDAHSRFMNERYIKWYTPLPSREFEMFVFGEERRLRLIP